MGRGSLEAAAGPLVTTATAPLLTLRPYQDEALTAVERAEVEGQRRVIVAHATGLGKTVLFATLIAKRPGRALVLAHRDELIGQAVAKLRMVAGDGLDVGVVKAERNEVHARVIVASVQTLARPARMDAVVNADGGLFGPLDAFSTVVIDEAHHSGAASYSSVLNAATGPDTLVVGVTATPERGDRRSLLKVFPGGIVHSMSTLDGIEGGWLTDVRALNVGTDLDLSKVRQSHGDYTDASLGEEMERAGVPERVAAAWVELAPERRGIAYLPTVATSQATLAAARRAGVRAEHVDGTTPEDVRRGVWADLASGRLDLVTNCMVATEGLDVPSVDCILMGRPTRSRVLYSQIIGRGLRPSPGKQDCLLLDITGRADKVDLASVWNVLGLKDPARVEAAKREAEASGALPPSVLEVVKGEREAAERKTEAVTLFERSRIRWVSAGAAWVLSLPGGRMLRLVPDEASWTWAVDEVQGRKLVERHREGLTLEYAQGIAEAIVRRRDEGWLRVADRKAAWRSKPASDKQVAYLRRLRVEVPAGCTAGQASDLISAARAGVA